MLLRKEVVKVVGSDFWTETSDKRYRVKRSDNSIVYVEGDRYSFVPYNKKMIVEVKQETSLFFNTPFEFYDIFNGKVL